MRDLSNLLWCDLESDTERVAFLEAGRGWETGIISKALTADFIVFVRARIALKDAADLCGEGCFPNGARIEEWGLIARA